MFERCLPPVEGRGPLGGWRWRSGGGLKSPCFPFRGNDNWLADLGVLCFPILAHEKKCWFLGEKEGVMAGLRGRGEHRSMLVDVVVDGRPVGSFVCAAELGEFPVRRGAGCAVRWVGIGVAGLLRSTAVRTRARERGRLVG